MSQYTSMQISDTKNGEIKVRSSAEILAEIATLGPMLPGSIRMTKQRRTNKKGQTIYYPAPPIYTTWDPVQKKPVSRCVPQESFQAIRTMTLEHKKLKALESELDAALFAENMPKTNTQKKSYYT